MFAVGEPERKAELNRMKRLATGLLVMVTLAFVVALVFEQRGKPPV